MDFRSRVGRGFPPAGEAEPWRGAAALAGAGIFVGSFDLGSISIALRPLATQWHLSTLLVTTLGTVTLVGMLIGSLGTGMLTDRIGRRKILVIDLLAFVLSGTIGALAPDYGVLLACRLVTGIAIGTDFAVVFPYVAEIAPGGKGGRAMAWIMWSANFGVLLSYGTGAIFLALSAQGWRFELGLGAALAVPLVALRRRIGESRRWEREHLTSWRQIVRHTVDEARQGSLVAMATNWFLYQVSDQGLTLLLPLIVATVLTRSAANGALGATLVKAVTIPAALLTVLLIDRLGYRPLQLAGFAGRGVALGVLGVLLLVTTHLPVAAGMTLLALAFFFGAAGPDKTIVIAPALAYPTTMRASGQGLSEAAGRVGGIVGVTGYGILAGIAGPGAGVLLFAGTCLLGAVLTLVHRERTGRTTADGEPREPGDPGPARPAPAGPGGAAVIPGTAHPAG